MNEIKTSKNGIDYLIKVLRTTAQTLTRSTLWRIPHSNSEKNEIALKIGRYKKSQGLSISTVEQLDSLTPKSELTLDGEEFQALITFLQNNYEPLKEGAKKFIPLDETFDTKNIVHLKAIFENPEKNQLLDFIATNNLIPHDLLIALHQLTKVKAIDQFKTMLTQDFNEHHWQKWFKENSWVLGTEFVKILDERAIDTANITDFLMQAYDGFIDIVEIKRPEGNLKFWSDQKDHENYIPHNDLVKAITQASKYIYEIEREANSQKFFERVGNVKTIKPRCILIYGRSNNWNDEQRTSYRLLNSSYHNLTIMTYDHILERANRLVS